MEEKRFHVHGWTRLGPTPKESDGVMRYLGEFDSKAEAEAKQLQSLEAGWGSVEIIDRDESPAQNGPQCGEGLYAVIQRRAKAAELKR